MHGKDLNRTRRNTAVLIMMSMVMLGIGGVTPVAAHSRLPRHLSGLLNDYTPPAPGVAGGPYEMHGRWALRLNQERGTAAFSAEMTMETADFANSDPSHDPTKLSPHTHHIKVVDGMIHDDPTDPINWKTACPTFKPPVADGFVVTGSAYITGNGGNPPFGNPSSVTICILGGTYNPSVMTEQAVVEFSNFTLSFGTGSLASTHFGTQAINGVVVKCGWEHEAQECELEAGE